MTTQELKNQIGEKVLLNVTVGMKVGQIICS